jgi:hypothetical protein
LRLPWLCKDISAGDDWKSRLGALIRDADTVVFVLSPSSARSETCAWEVTEAVRLGKRILPVLCRSIEGTSPPPQLTALNYIYFFDEPRFPGSGFGCGLVGLVLALNTDLDWLREHTRYLQRATEWDAGGRPASRLLSGSDITTAKAWAARRPKNVPEPTELQLDFIKGSEAEEIRQQSAEAQRLQEIAEAQAERGKALAEREAAQAREAEAQKREVEAQRRETEQARRVAQRTQMGLVGAAVSALIFLVLGLVAFHQRNNAIKQASIALSRQLATQASYQVKSDQLDLALLLSVEADRAADTSEARSILFTSLQTKPRLLQYVRVRGSTIESMTTDASGKHALLGTSDGSLILWDIENRAQSVVWRAENGGSIRTVAFDKAGHSAALVTDAGRISVWSLSAAQTPERVQRSCGRQSIGSSLESGWQDRGCRHRR